MPSGRSSFASRIMIRKDTENDVGGQNASLLDAVIDWEAARQRPIVLQLALLTFMELAEDVEKFWGTAKARQNFPQCITAERIKDLGQVYESCIYTHVLFTAFLLFLPQHEDHVYGPSLGPEPILAFWRAFGMGLISKMRAMIFPARESRVMPR